MNKTYWIGNLRTTIDSESQCTDFPRNGISIRTYKKIGYLDIPNRRLFIELFFKDKKISIRSGIKNK